jgi:hypothetical protein
MELFQIDEDGRLFMSAAIHQWNILASRGVDVVIDLEGGLDLCIPTQANHCLYVYFPFDDDDRMLPSLVKLRAIAQLAASLMRDGHTVLSHCSSGFNRSGLVAGLILTELGMSGAEALARIRSRRPGALYNGTFADYLASVGAAATSG